MTPNIAVLRHHVSLEVRRIGKLCLHAYMPKLQTSGGRCYCFHDHLGHPVPSPALFKPMHDRCVTAVEHFVARHAMAVFKLESGQDKDTIATAHRARLAAREGVVMLSVAQEECRAFKAHKRTRPDTKVTLDFLPPMGGGQSELVLRARPRLGSGLVKFGTYLPYPVKICLNGHEWVK